MPYLNVEWNEPTPTIARWPHMAGAAFLQALKTGELPIAPILAVFDVTEGEIGEGWIEFHMRPQPFMVNLAGTVHGGVLATLIDTALTCALVTRLPKGKACVSIDLQMRFFRPVRPSAHGRLVARGEVLNAGATIGTTQGEIRDDRNRLIVHATSSLAIADAHTLLQAR